jgi:hypothetical protein
VTEFPDELATDVLELCDDEAIALWTAMHRGFLTWVNPTDLLLRTFTLIRLLEGHTAVVLMPDPRLSLLVASVPDMDWLAPLIQRLCEAGACLQRVMPEVGVVSALVPGHRAHGIAKEAAAFGTRRTWGTREGCGGDISPLES